MSLLHTVSLSLSLPLPPLLLLSLSHTRIFIFSLFHTLTHSHTLAVYLYPATLCHKQIHFYSLSFHFLTQTLTFTDSPISFINKHTHTHIHTHTHTHTLSFPLSHTLTVFLGLYCLRNINKNNRKSNCIISIKSFLFCNKKGREGLFMSTTSHTADKTRNQAQTIEDLKRKEKLKLLKYQLLTRSLNVKISNKRVEVRQYLLMAWK